MQSIKVYSLLLLVVGCFLWTSVAGWGKSRDLRGERATVSGTVFLDGQSVEAADIIFESIDHDPVVKVRGVITDGSFTLPAEYGPIVGTNRVRIVSRQMELEEFEMRRRQNPGKQFAPVIVTIPARYSQNSQLHAEVTSAELDNMFHFDLKKN